MKKISFRSILTSTSSNITSFTSEKGKFNLSKEAAKEVPIEEVKIQPLYGEKPSIENEEEEEIDISSKEDAGSIASEPAGSRSESPNKDPPEQHSEDSKSQSISPDKEADVPIQKLEEKSPEPSNDRLEPIHTDNVMLSSEERKKILRKYPFFKIDVVMVSGQNLLAMDRRGSSDPYVKCIQGQERLFQTKYISRSLNPSWNETFICHTDNPFKPLTLQVYDHDVLGSDQFMGEAQIDLTDFQIKRPLDLTLSLVDGDNEDLIKKNKKRKPLGSISLNLIMFPLTKEERNEHIIALSGPRKIGMSRSMSTISGSSSPRDGFQWSKVSLRHSDGLSESNLQILRADKAGKASKSTFIWNSVINVVVVQALGLEIPADAGDTCDPYCKLLFGKEKIRSKPMVATINPKWRESFNFFWYEDVDNEMEVTLWHNNIGGKDSFLGRVKIDMSDFDVERNYNFWRDVSDGKGKVHFIVTISATTTIESPSNLINWEEELDRQKVEWEQDYTLQNSFKNIKDVGHCMVKVLKAQGLASSDMSGKSDPFCTVELCNVRFSTHTEYKTLNPMWQKVFQFDVLDIHDVVEVTVFHEGKDRKYEPLGKVAIPLLKIRNSERRWYALKDKKLRVQAKGDSPQIQLELFVVYNKFRGSIRTFNPKQLKYTDKSDIKLKQSLFMQNVNRIKLVFAKMKPELIVEELKKILIWQSRWKSLLVLVGAEAFLYFFEIWMLPLLLIIPITKNFAVLSISGGGSKVCQELENEEDDEDDPSPGASESEKKSIRERMQAMQDITLMVQNGLGAIAHVLESVGNIFNFSVPFITWLLFVVLCLVSVLLYYVPIRYIIMVWTANKISKRFFRPNLIDNNELADFISHVPDNEMLKTYRELPSFEEKERKKLFSSRALNADKEII